MRATAGAVGLAFGFSVLFAFSACAELTAKAYVQSGLVAHWDAVENVGYGRHSDETKVWKDLVGGYDMTVEDERATWEARSFVPPQDLYTVAAQADAALTRDKYVMMDVCATFRTSGEDTPYCVCGQWGRAFSWAAGRFNGRFGAYMFYADFLVGRAHSVVFDYMVDDVQVKTAFADGVEIEASQDDGGWISVDAHSFVIGRDINEWWSSTAPVNGVRLYDRSLAPWEVRWNANVDAIRFNGADGSALTWPEGVRYANESLQFRIDVVAETVARSKGGQIAVSGGETGERVTAWKPYDSAMTLTPVPASGKKFFLWTGDTDGLAISAEGVVTLDNKVRSLICVFADETADAKVCTWSGNAGTEEWSDEENWTPAGVPAAGDAVRIPAGKTVHVGDSTPMLAMVECSGALEMSGWTTCVSADLIAVCGGGVLTCSEATPVGGDYAVQNLNRVNLVCTDLRVAEGAKIDAFKKGWTQGVSDWTTRGWGPGATDASSITSPSHGGYGVTAKVNSGEPYWWAVTYPVALPYDDPAAPVEPGSSGCYSIWGRGGYGGGAVRIDALEDVRVDGSIVADGGSCGDRGPTADGWDHSCGGSGGSVYITCGTISGSGIISAEGGGGANPTVANPSLPAGGGCIAIHYDALRQTPEMVTGMRISSGEGTYLMKDLDPGHVRDVEDLIPASSIRDSKLSYVLEPDLGTVWFTDDKIVRALLGRGLTGQIRNITNYTHEGDLNFTTGRVRFAEEGATVTVSGNLTLDGDDARLEIGGCQAVKRTSFLEVYAGKRVNRLDVSGDLTLRGVSRLDVRAAETNGIDRFGAVVTVGGTMTIGSNSLVYAWCDVLNGGAPRFEVGGLTVDEGALFSARRRGGSGTGMDGSGIAYGVSSGGVGVIGGGHGGAGGGATDAAGRVSGDTALRPTLPGSGGGGSEAYGGAGGGVISVAAGSGRIRIDGTLNADGVLGSNHAGGGAGGSILLEAAAIAVGETGVLTARGADSMPLADRESGAGGGGRISLIVGQPWYQGIPRGRLTSRSTPFGDDAYPGVFSFKGTVDAAGGVPTGDLAAQGVAGEAGTTLYTFVGKPKGSVVLIR